MKSRQELIDNFRHDVSGVMLDAYLNERRGSELSVAMRAGMRKIDRLSAQLYDALVPPTTPAPSVNGQAIPQPTKART